MRAPSKTSDTQGLMPNLASSRDLSFTFHCTAPCTSILRHYARPTGGDSADHMRSAFCEAWGYNGR